MSGGVPPRTGKQLVLELIEDGFGQRQPEVFHRLVADDYVQHNPMVPPGREGLLGFLEVVKGIPDNRFTIYTLVEDGPYVASHAVWQGAGMVNAVIDLFRIEGGQFREHWDVMQPIPAPGDGPPMVGPARQPGEPDRTAANKRLVEHLAAEALVGGNFAALSAACAPDLVQHDPGVAAGAAAFVEHLAGGDRRFARVHRVLGEGDLVLVQAEGRLGAEPAALYDLFRLSAGRIVEHWSVSQAIPATMAHGNGMF